MRTIFQTRLVIGIDLKDFFSEIETYFMVKINSQILSQIVEDSEKNMVDEKKYEILEKKSGFFKKPIIIEGEVDEYEPETIWISIKNASTRERKHFEDWVRDRPFVKYRKDFS